MVNCCCTSVGRGLLVRGHGWPEYKCRSRIHIFPRISCGFISMEYGNILSPHRFSEHTFLIRCRVSTFLHSHLHHLLPFPPLVTTTTPPIKHAPPNTLQHFQLQFTGIRVDHEIINCNKTPPCEGGRSGGSGSSGGGGAGIWSNRLPSEY